MKHYINTLLLLSLFIFNGCSGGGDDSTNESPSNTKIPEITSQAKLKNITTSKFMDSFSILDFTDSLAPLDTFTYEEFYPDNFTFQGPVSGSLKSTTVDISNTTIQQVIEFINYNDGSYFKADGKIIYTLTVDRNSNFISSMHIEEKNFRIYDETGSMTTNSSATLIFSKDNGINSLVQDLTIEYRDTNFTDKVVRFENLEIIFGENSNILSYSGKINNSSLGYVTISTPHEFTYSKNNEPLIGGEILYESADSKIRERIAYDGRVRVEFDFDKNDVIDKVEIYDMDTLALVANSAPIVKFPLTEKIYTNTDISNLEINIYDPDLDDFTFTSQWKVNNTFMGSTMSSDAYVKNDTLSLTIDTIDDKGLESTFTNTWKVSNTRPITTMSLDKIVLDVGETQELEYSVFDADNEEIFITWKHYPLYNEEYTSYLYEESIRYCTEEIEYYDSVNPNKIYTTLSEYAQEDFNRTYCSQDFIPDHPADFIFVNEDLFEAVYEGSYLHEMTITDGTYSRTKTFFSKISKMDLIEKQISKVPPLLENNSYSRTYNVYIGDFDNDGNDNLIYISTNEGKSFFTIANKVGEEIVDQATHYIPAFNDYYIHQLNDYYIHDIDGNGMLDIIFRFESLDGNSFLYGKILQNTKGELLPFERFVLTNSEYPELYIDDISGNGSGDIITIMDTNLTIHSSDTNRTININLPSISEYEYEFKYPAKKILVHDLNEDSKKDIIIVNKNNSSFNLLTLQLSILLQDSNGTFDEKVYTKVLDIDEETDDQIIDVKIADLGDHSNVFIVTTGSHIHLLTIQDEIKIIKRITCINSNFNTIMLEPIDVNNDGKKDLILVDNYPDNFLSIFIQNENLDFLLAQNYALSDKNFFFPSFVLSDLDNNGKPEIYLSTGDKELSSIYFK